MSEYIGKTVVSLAGHDKGYCFLVLAEEGGYLLLADGKYRRIEKPKRKKKIHTLLLHPEAPPFDMTEVTDRRIREYLKNMLTV